MKQSKIYRKLLSVALAALPDRPACAAGRKNVLSKKSITMTKGKTRTLKVKRATKKVKWSTTNKKVARVAKTKGKRRQKAFIKAGKKPGKCWIKAKVGKKVLKCRVTVKKGKKGSEVIVGPVEEWTEREIETRPVKSKD